MVGLRVKINLPALLCSVFLVSTPVIAKECVDCHSDILKQFKGNSHHIQGTAVSGRHCYVCHWEATAEGQINSQYHKAPSTRKIAKSRGVVDLVVWQNGERPTEHTKNVTAVTFSSASVGGASERLEVSKISSHCLSCHNDVNNDTRPFFGDDNSPLKYAWDGQSVASRYSEKAVTIWGKYSTAATNKKSKIIKAFSAHGNSVANRGGWNAVDGYDGATTVTRGGAKAKNVECFDCHNSHGSKISGVTTSYRSFTGAFNGGILKDTVPGQSGYRAAYKPSANADASSRNPYNAGAGLCFDCHETSKKGATPWDFKTTFGAEQPIIGYKDTLRFNNGAKGSTSRFSNRQGRSDIASSHLKAGSFLNYSAHGRINGLCTPCHDPHGISRTLGDKMPYAVPLLKGTWLTSPYREDGPPATMQNKPGGGESRTADYNDINRTAGANFGKGDSSAPRKADFNSTNRDGNANFGRGDSSAPRSGDYNSTNRDAGANFGKGDSSAPRKADFNSTNRDGNANFGRGDSSAPRSGDYNSTNRDAGANFGKGDSGAPRKADFNSTNRDGNANYGKGDSSSPRKSDFNSTNREDNSNFGKMVGGTPREPMQGMQYSVDRNTFGGDKRITENDETFAGLCLKCHAREKFAGNSKTALIHRAVKGWGDNREHSFPCSKCHQAHNSGLPRLMQTNCFQEGPSGLRENSGLSWLPYRNRENPDGAQAAEKSGDAAKNKVVGCHVRQFGKTGTAKAAKQAGQWKELTPW